MDKKTRDKLTDGFRQIYGEYNLPVREDLLSDLVTEVDRLLASATGIRFRNTHPEICAEGRNGLDLMVRTDMDRDIASIDFTGSTKTDGAPVAELVWGDQ